MTSAVYLDNAASAQKPRAVLTAMTELPRVICECPPRRSLPLGQSNAALRSRAGTVRRFVNAAHVDEIVFTKGGTEAINLVASSFLAPRIRPRDEIVLTTMEHHSNIVPWHSCASATVRC